MGRKTEQNSKSEITLVCDLTFHSIISYQASFIKMAGEPKLETFFPQSLGVSLNLWIALKIGREISYNIC